MFDLVVTLSAHPAAGVDDDAGSLHLPVGLDPLTNHVGHARNLNFDDNNAIITIAVNFPSQLFFLNKGTTITTTALKYYSVLRTFT